MRFKITTPPASEPLSVEQAKAHLRANSTEDDLYIADLIRGARETVEEHTRRALITQTITLKLDGWPCRQLGYGRGDGPSLRRAIALPRPPLIAVQSIAYIDANGTSQTLASSEYQVVDSGEPAYLVPAYGKSWPTVRAQPDAVTIVLTAGYGNAGAVPQRAKQAMLLLIGHRDANREAVNVGSVGTELPMAVESLLMSLSWGSYA